MRTGKVGIPGIEYVGYVSDERLSDLYRNACCLACPSLYEALDCRCGGNGLPVVR